jgi:MSHA pilin protein MshD
MSSRFARQRGVTLVELIIFMMVVGIALMGILAAMNLSSSRSADPIRRKQALMIAEGLLEEVGQAKFSYCDPASETADSSSACTIPENWGQLSPEPSANGRPFDNVNDYVAKPGVATLAFNNAAGALADASGNALGVTGYTARLTISPATLGGVGVAGTAADTDVLRIMVQVDYDGQSLVLEGYRLRYAPKVQ